MSESEFHLYSYFQKYTRNEQGIQWTRQRLSNGSIIMFSSLYLFLSIRKTYRFTILFGTYTNKNVSYKHLEHFFSFIHQ